MSLKGGVITIGSLFWDKATERKKWRKDNLSIDDKYQIYLPIRYGRCSGTRNNTYTVVFSLKCYSKGYGLGTAWIIPIKAEINSFSDLETEAKQLGIAEGIGDGFSKNWGSVALLVNPKREIDDTIIIGWKKLMEKGLIGHPLFTEKLKSEKAPIDSNGFLNIKWPEELRSKKRIDEFDFLIATAIVPSLVKGRYPTVHRIADSMKNVECYKYYKKNREHEITTFQDLRIFKQINRKDFVRKG